MAKGWPGWLVAVYAARGRITAVCPTVDSAAQGATVGGRENVRPLCAAIVSQIGCQ